MKKYLVKSLMMMAALALFAIPVHASTIARSLAWAHYGEDADGYLTGTTGAKFPELWLGASGSEVQLTADVATLNRLGSGASRIVAVTAATLTVTEAAHDGKIITLDKADGQAITLPHATGSGDKFTFVVKTTITSVGTTIKVPSANPTDSFIGMAWVMSDNSQAVLAYLPTAGDDTITLNGTTTGGYAGCKIQMEDVALGLYEVNTFCKATGTEATPFSATVS